MSTLMQSIEECLPAVNQRLEELVPLHDGLTATIHEAMAYSLHSGGKRLRPMLCIFTAQLLGRLPSYVLDIACAIEMIHTYSLIHDDLPALDNDELRRGRPTNHCVYGEAMAILAGDALLNQAFQTLCRVELPAEILLEVIQVIADAAGTTGMIGGQVVDIQSEGKHIEMDTLRFMHEHKTGALLRSCLTSAAIACEATTEERNLLDCYGYNIGLAFQIADDILDIEGDEETLGKPVGSDAQNRKSTWPALVGMANARKTMESLVDEAIQCLDAFEPSPARQTLVELARYTIERKQ
ncbi:polyprenyl synthetase family protein [Desulfurispira natronophila]|uniref:Geranylgeranyl diphosphate synthase type II n=1 Tax=Desulfurispira natronophila TaxID=682562 RepID=A0A7W7Y434_9BACT|nr:farnesyl diphosphate synthase [Desulfurispira natronophila]MBB5021679.1 geranylgeranyl diphosphate synthase type II [Desulfurispira natronophila]